MRGGFANVSWCDSLVSLGGSIRSKPGSWRCTRLSSGSYLPFIFMMNLSKLAYMIDSPHDLLQDIIPQRLRVACRIHNNYIIIWTKWALNPLSEKCARIYDCIIVVYSRSRGAVNASALTRHRNPRAQPLIQQFDILNLALDISVRVVVLFDKCGSLIENVPIVTSAVDDNDEILLDEILGQCPLKLISILCYLIEWDVGFQKTGSKHVVINNHATDLLSEQCRYRTLPRIWRIRYLDEELV